MAQLEELTTKYHGAIDAIHDNRVRLTHLHVEDDKLVLQGSVPSEEGKDAVMKAIQAVDPECKDVQCELKVDPSLSQPPQMAGPEQGAGPQQGAGPADTGAQQ